MRLRDLIANAVRRSPSPPRAGRLIRPMPEDSWRHYPADGLTPQRLVSILRAADTGDPGEMLGLFEQMEEKDPHLFAVAAVRRLAVTGLPWQIVSAADLRTGVDRRLADEAADHCRGVLESLDHFDAILAHLQLATGRNVAVAELVWQHTPDGVRLEAIEPVDFGRLTFNDRDELRITTHDEPVEGIAPPPNKFVVHTPHAVSGHVTRGGLGRVTALSYLGKHLAMKDWLVFAEVFGMPIRVGRYEPSATEAEKRELLDMLTSLGTDAAGIFSKAVDLELKHPTGGPLPPYEALCNFLNREISKAWLGQTLTTETAGATGTFAAAAIHDEVRRDIRDDDLRREAHTLRRDLLGPLCRLRWGAAAPVPFFCRQTADARDQKDLADVLAVAINDLGARVPARWVHETLGLPQPADGEPTLPGRGDACTTTA